MSPRLFITGLMAWRYTPSAGCGVARVCDGPDVARGGFLDVDATETGDEDARRGGARGKTLLAGDVAHEGDIAPVVNPRTEGTVEDAAAGRGSPGLTTLEICPFLFALKIPTPSPM